jgi:hypothetical protein
MDRLTSLFEQLSLPEVARILRRTALCALVLGIVAFAVSVPLSQVYVGLGICIGLAGGLLNVRLITRGVAKVNEAAPERPRRVLASQTLLRLGGTTAAIVALMIASVPLGLATAAGVALYYFVLIANVLRELLRPTPGLTA